MQDRYVGRVAPATAYKYNVYLRGWLRELHSQGAPDLLSFVRRVAAGRPRCVVPSDREREALLDCPDPALRWVATVAAEAGLRFETACAITPQHFVQDRLVIRTKRGVTMNLPVSAGIRRCLMGLSPSQMNSDARVLDLLNGRPLKSWSVTIHERWAKWRKRCGVDRKITFHDLRRGLARRVFESSGDIRLVQSLLGHQQMATTFWYLHEAHSNLTDEVLTAALRQKECA